MSVFSDFMQVFLQRCPEGSLSDVWEQDVRASLTRHQQKVAELTKELEKETMYVEYLERLLSDVEIMRKGGGLAVEGIANTSGTDDTTTNSTTANITSTTTENEVIENDNNVDNNNTDEVKYSLFNLYLHFNQSFLSVLYLCVSAPLQSAL